MSDPRFARLKTDPRFRRPKQKNLKVEIDDRFKDVLESEEFGGKGKGKGKASGRVDKRGRPLATSHHADQLKRFYRLRSPQEGEGEGEDGEEGKSGFVDYARGEGNLESSGSEDESEIEGSENEFDGEEELEIGGKRKSKLPGYISQSDSDSEDSEESDEDHLNIDLSENEAESAFPPETSNLDEEEEEEEESVPATTRIAAVNLDWDNLQAQDLYSVFNSFLQLASSSSIKNGESSTSKKDLGKLINVKIYPSEFGKERMEKEEQEGPGGGIFATKHSSKNSKKNKGPKEAIVPKKRADESEESEDEEEEEDEEDEEEESEGDLEEDEEEFESDGLSDEEEEVEDENDEDEQPKRSNDQPREDIEGLEIISDVESDAGSEDIDMDQLRQYQLERLRYFYAIATFSTVAAAEYVMNECNGTEFERTANIMDLSYVPDGMEFAEDEIRDEANKEPKAYKGNDFVTDALRHSKVKLTWDQDDPNRVKMTRRTLTRDEIEEQDFNNLVAGSGSEASLSSEEEEEDEEADPKGKGQDKKSKKATKKERTEKLRNLLLAGNESDGDIWGKSGTSFADQLSDPKDSKSSSKNKKIKDDGMEITFKPALSTKLGGEAKDEENMTTLEKYQLRMKEKKNRKKEKMELKRATKEIENGDEDGVKGGEEDDFFGSDSEKDNEDEENEDDEEVEIDFKRPTKSKLQVNGKSSKSTSKSIRKDEPSEVISALIGDSTKEDTNFSMKDILKSEKESKKRRRRGKGNKKDDDSANNEEPELGPDGWKINVSDPRFKVIHEESEFAIDPSNPHFTKTKAMKDLLSHRTTIRQRKNNENEIEGKSSASGIKKIQIGENATENGGEKDLSQLVKSVKRQMEREGNKKRKRRR